MSCSKRLEKQNYIYIYNQPQANFSVSDSIFCVGNTSITKQISFTNNSSSDAVNYLWNFGDGTSDTMKNPATKTYGIGFYDVSLTVTNQYGCKDTLKKKDHIIITLFKANFNVSDSVLCKRDKTFNSPEQLMEQIFIDGNSMTDKKALEVIFNTPTILRKIYY